MAAISEGKMTEQQVLTLLSASCGFVAAVFFCIGNAFNSAKNIALQSSSFYNANLALARSLAAQRAQYAAGALLLVAAFVLQVWAALASSTSLATLPQLIDTWLSLVLAGVVAISLVGIAIAANIYKTTMRKVLKTIQCK